LNAVGIPNRQEQIMRSVRTGKVESQEAALWTPWGTERPAEREAQKAAIRRLIRKVAELRRRQKVQIVQQ